MVQHRFACAQHSLCSPRQRALCTCVTTRVDFDIARYSDVANSYASMATRDTSHTSGRIVLCRLVPSSKLYDLSNTIMNHSHTPSTCPCTKMSLSRVLKHVGEVVTVTIAINELRTRQTWRLDDWDTLMKHHGSSTLRKMVLTAANMPPDKYWEVHYFVAQRNTKPKWKWGAVAELICDLADEREFVGPGTTLEFFNSSLIWLLGATRDTLMPLSAPRSP